MIILYLAFVFIISSLEALISLHFMVILGYVLTVVLVGAALKWAESRVKN